MIVKTGDRVKLRSGGPMMTVVEIIDASTVKCIWFDTDHHKLEDVFPTVILMNESNPQPRDDS